MMHRPIHPNKRRGPVALRPDDVTTIMSYRGELTDGLFCPDVSKPAYGGNPGLIYRFSGPQERLTWTVLAPADDDYAVAIVCCGDDDILDDCEIELQCNERVLTRMVGARTGWERNFFRRSFDAVLPLRKGSNRMSFRLPHGTWPSGAPTIPEGGDGTLKFGQKIGFGIRSIELMPESGREGLRQRAQSIRADASWMMDGKYGLFVHWSPLCFPLYGNRRRMAFHKEAVNLFDVEAFADAVAETGAAWVCLTTSHGPQYWPGPSETIDRILPGRTAHRDLIGEVAAALKMRGIRLMLYYHFSVHEDTDVAWAEAAGAYDVNPERWFANVEAIFRETSLRYGKAIEGFGYIDDGGHIAYQYDPPWERWARAIKAGNPHALVGVSVSGCPNMTVFNELQVDDDWSSLVPPSSATALGPGSHFGEIVQARWFFMDAWCPSDPLDGVFRDAPVYPEETYVHYFREMAAAGVPLTVNLMITADVTRNQPFFNPQSMAIMKAIRQELRGDGNVHVKTKMPE